MVGGIFAITFGAVVLVIGPRWTATMANKFRQSGAEIDPNFLKVGTVVLGLAAIVLGIIEVTKALR